MLSEALEVNRSVTAISLIRNDIGDEGAQARGFSGSNGSSFRVVRKEFVVVFYCRKRHTISCVAMILILFLPSLY